MKKKGLYLTMVFACIAALAGCQEAPKESDSGGIPHAQNSVERELQDIVEGERTEASAGGYNDIIGTEENGLRINGEVPVLPENVYQITLSAENALDQKMLTVLMDSRTGDIRDVTQETLALQEEQRRQDAKDDNSVIYLAALSDGTSLYLEDGEKEASFWGTSVKYQDITLYGKCAALYNTIEPVEISVNRQEASEGFSTSHAEEILMDKLQALGIAEICTGEILFYEKDGFAFYEIDFSPSYEGMRVLVPQQTNLGEVFPGGNAWITEDGVANLYLDNFCGKVVSKTKQEKVLDFSQVTQILDTYLQNGLLQGALQTELRTELSRIELSYYPIYKEPELVLVPVWHICVPSKEWQEFIESGGGVSVHDIYVNAVTGELEKVY